MKKRILAMVMTAVLSLSLAACGSKETKTEDSSKTAVTETEVAEAEVKEETAEEVKKLSGSVTVYMPSPTNLNTAYVEGFEEKTGVKVELFEGTTGEILARLEAEQENPVADVVVLASWSDGLSLKEKGMLESYPEAENAEKLQEGWVDADHMLFGTSASAVGVIYNTTLIENLDADWAELADEQYQDLTAIPDPEKSGSCKDFLAGYLYANGDDWSVWERMADKGLVVAGANKAALEAVMTGEKAILIAGVDYNAYANKEKGEPIDIYYPESGTVINPRPAMILNSSKNMENAKAFLEYLMSEEAQKLVTESYLLPGRTDITCENRTNVADIPTFADLDWDAMMKNSDEAAAKLNALCK